MCTKYITLKASLFFVYIFIFKLNKCVSFCLVIYGYSIRVKHYKVFKKYLEVVLVIVNITKEACFLDYSLVY